MPAPASRARRSWSPITAPSPAAWARPRTRRRRAPRSACRRTGSSRLYAGRINAQKGLDQLLALADLRPDTLFLLIGSEGEGAIEAEAAARANVRVLPWQAPAELPAWLHAADVLLIPPSRAPLERYRNCVLPLKLFSYLAAGRPILAPIAPDTAELLGDGDNALLVPPGDPQAAAAALDRLRDPALAARLGANAYARSAELTWDARAEKIHAFLEERLGFRAGIPGVSRGLASPALDMDPAFAGEQS